MKLTPGLKQLLQRSALALAASTIAISFFSASSTNATAPESQLYWMKVRAKDKFERSVIAAKGVSIEAIREDFVTATGTYDELKEVEKLGWTEVSFAISDEMGFPVKDDQFHTYAELRTKLQKLSSENPEFTRLQSIGKTREGRDIWHFRIAGDIENADQYPGISFMGGHHAREHLSVELPLNYIDYIVTEYRAGNPRIVKLVNSRDIHFIPVVNPDGKEFDIADGRYKMWRKNRANNGSTYGVDLNRNYGYKWGTGGSSKSPSSDTYMGTAPFSEPETKAIKSFIEQHQNISIVLSFHTYSELILYPWGHSYEGIQNARDKQVHEIMASTMSQWNGYTPQQSSELYIASGDTTDWTYGEHKIISFTFELDPSNQSRGGFYPGAGFIEPVTQKNLEPVLYLTELADNPYRVLDNKSGPILRP